jgi:pyrroloquinoline quinone biosynthesis protein E
MIRYARSKHIWVRSTNNGSLLHYAGNYKKLIDSGINEAQVSVDGTTKHSFEKIRRGGNFKLVMDNCKLLNDYCNELGLLRTRMWTVLQRDNQAEFLDFIPLAHELGFPRATFSMAMTDWGQDHWTKANAEASVDDAITPEVAEKAIELGRGLGVQVTFWNSVGKNDTQSPEHLCRWPFQWAFISSDMRVAPCAIISNPDVHELGDARRFTQTWNSQTYREFRLAHLEGRIPVVCRGCYELEVPKAGQACK